MGQETSRLDATSNRRWVNPLRPLVICVATALGILAFFLSIYSVRGYVEPIGYDTPHYIWRQNCVALLGVEALEECAPPAGRAWPSRVANPLIAIPLTSVLGVSRFTFAAILPPVAAVGIAFAAAALVASAARLGAGGVASVAIVVGTSPMVVRMAGPEGYADMMLATALGMVALVVTRRVIDEGAGYLPAMMLLATAYLTHWPTAAVFTITLAAMAILRLPQSTRTSREGGSFLSTTSGRLAVVLGGGIAAWAVALGALGASPDRFRGNPEALARKFRAYLPRYGLPLSLPAAVVGGFRLRRTEGGVGAERQRFLGPVFGLWLIVVAAAVAGWLLGWKIPVDRFLMVALPVPMLAAVALLWSGELLARRSRGLARSAVVVVLAGVVAVGYFLWLHVTPVLQPERLSAAATAAHYLEETVATDRPVTVIAEGPVPEVFEMTESLWAAFPAERLRSVHVLHGFPHKAVVREPDPGGPVVLLLAPYSKRFDDLATAMPRRVAAPSVFVMRGPIPEERLAPAPVVRLDTTGPMLVLLAFAALAGLAIVGSGWTVAALGRDTGSVVLCLLAPCFGLAFLVAGALVADLVGIRLEGLAGTVVFSATGIAGLVAAWSVLRRDSPTGVSPLARSA